MHGHVNNYMKHINRPPIYSSYKDSHALTTIIILLCVHTARMITWLAFTMGAIQPLLKRSAKETDRHVYSYYNHGNETIQTVISVQ